MIVPYDFRLLNATRGEQFEEFLALRVVFLINEVQFVLFVINLIFGSKALLELDSKEVLNALVKVLQDQAFRLAHEVLDFVSLTTSCLGKIGSERYQLFQH